MPLGELIGVVSIEAVINCNEVDVCMSASKYDCHSVTALHLAHPALGFSGPHTPSEWVVATVCAAFIQPPSMIINGSCDSRFEI